MKIELHAKDLINGINKALTVMPKKSSYSPFQRIYIFAKDDEVTLKVSDSEQWLAVKVDARVNEEGIAVVDNEDLKALTKAKDWLVLSTDSDKLSIKMGKKTVTIKNYDYDNVVDAADQESKVNNLILTCKSEWLKETLSNLATFTKVPDFRVDMMSCINVNTQSGRFEALDGHRIGYRTIDGKVDTETKSVPIYNIAVKPMSKVLSKGDTIEIRQLERYIEISGIDFVYK